MFPRQFWVFVAGVFLFNVAIAVGMPYETLFLNSTMHFSMTTVGILWGVAAFAGLPMQLVGGVVTDRRGRRGVLAVSAATIIFFYTGMAVAHHVWQVAVIAIVEGAIGWPLFLTASNAMIADWLPVARRPEAYGIWRLAINAGVIFGPAIAGLLIAAHYSYRVLFATASIGCGVFLVMIIFWVKETKPRSADRATAGDAPQGGGQVGVGAGAEEAILAAAEAPEFESVGDAFASYRTIFRDRRFLSFSLVSLLTLFGFGQFLWIFPVFLVRTLRMAPGSWGLLLAVCGLTIAVLQYPLVRLMRHRDSLLVMALAALLIAVGVGGVAFAVGGWTVGIFVVIFAVGEVLLWPISSSIVSDYASEELRGRYMGAWTLVDCFGRGLGPMFGGWAIGALGGRQTFFIDLVVGLVGSALFVLLSVKQRRPAASA